MSAERTLCALDIADQIWRSAKDGAGWVGGVVAGEFNGKQTTGQIITDAVISMFPVAGEVTAARDAVAIGLRLADSPDEADDTFDWIALVLCLIAVVPVLGGVLKGVGKLIVRAAAKSEDLVKLGAEILAFLRKMGYGDPAKWLRQLDFVQYQGDILKAFTGLIERLKGACTFIPDKLSRVLPDRVINYLKALPPKLDRLRRCGERMIPESIKELNRCLNQVRGKLIDGSFADIVVGKAGNSKAMVTEGRLGRKAVAEAIKSKGHLKADVDHFRRKEGWPNLRSDQYRNSPIPTFSRLTPIEAVELKAGSHAGLVRVIDMEQLKAGEKFVKDGRFWTEQLPENGKVWRLDCAVMQHWSANGGYVELTRVPTAEELITIGIAVPVGWTGMRTWRGKIAEQFDRTTGLLLPGGEIQHFIDFTDPHNAPVGEYVKQLSEELTGWKDVNLPENIEATIEYLSQRERSAKIRQEGYLMRGTASGGKQANNQESP